jgi:hypothetical protein
MNDDPHDPWVRAGRQRDLVATRFAGDLEALIGDARDRGLSDAEILAKLREASDAVHKGLT